MNGDKKSIGYYVHRALAVLLVIVLAWALWKIRIALLLAFGGILFAVFLSGLARQIHTRTPLGRSVTVGIVIALLAVATVAFWWNLGPHLARQFDLLTQTLPETLEQLTSSLRNYTWGQEVLAQFQVSETNLIDRISMSRVTGYLSAFLNGLVAAFIVLFVGIYFAFDPGLYRRGIVHLVPPEYHDQAWEVLDSLGNALWHWLLGRFVAILFVFAATSIGLYLLGVPLALLLGFIAGILDFVPFIGPLVAAVPGILLAFTVGPMKALYAALLYIVIQQIEGNIITPLVQQRAVSLPPALVVLSLTAFGLIFGVLGIILAVPLLVVVMVTVSILYVQHTLHEPVDTPGQ